MIIIVIAFNNISIDRFIFYIFTLIISLIILPTISIAEMCYDICNNTDSNNDKEDIMSYPMTIWPFRNSVSKILEIRCENVSTFDTNYDGTGFTAATTSHELMTVCGAGTTAEKAEANLRKEIENACKSLSNISMGLDHCIKKQ